ncbi:nucleotidyltransferase domain-containing protein [Arthrobacter sp. MDT3-24]
MPGIHIELLLNTVVETVVMHCDPDQILLFGSWAKGTAHHNSDIDILVIGPFTAPRWARARGLEGSLRELPIEVDLHMLTPAEYETGRAKPHFYLNTLGETAMSIYRRPLTGTIHRARGSKSENRANA